MTLEEFAKIPRNCVFADALQTYKAHCNSYDYGFLCGWLLSLSAAEQIIQSDLNNLFSELDSIWNDAECND